MGNLMNKFIKLFCFLGIASVICVHPASADDDDSMLEGYNRAMFGFNTVADDYVIKPVAKGYRAVTTSFIRERVHNFFFFF